MTKAELVDEVARVVQLTKKQAETIVNIVFDSIVDSLRAGQKIELRGFGSFRLRSRKSRTGRNPKTGEKVEVPSKKIPYFKPGKELKELINKALVEGGPDGSGEAAARSALSSAIARRSEAAPIAAGSGAGRPSSRSTSS